MDSKSDGIANDSGNESSKPKRIKLDNSNVFEEMNDLLETGNLPEANKYPFLELYEGGFSYQLLTVAEVEEMLLQCIQETQSVLDLSKHSTRLLLSHFAWEKDRLYEKYFENEEAFKLLWSQLGIEEPKSVTGQPPKECDICGLNHPASHFFRLPTCGHYFCRLCIIKYLETCISEGKSDTIGCPTLICSSFIDDVVVTQLIDNQLIIEKYRLLIVKEYVEGHKKLRWCPGAHCDTVVKVVNRAPKPVRCSCGTLFCFYCGELSHGPLKCAMMKTWKRKCEDESETSNWISANTKDCPQCNSPIEKNGGCNHMSCKKCRHEFCWVCLGSWAAHKDAYNCNRYNEQASKEKETSRKALERYLFYANRFMNHVKSLKLERGLWKKVEDKKKELHQRNNMTNFETRYLDEAVNTLRTCRQVLSCTYGFAFFLGQSNEAIIFEDNQRDLELATEKLSHLLEKDLEEMELTTIKPTVLNLSGYCDSRRQALLNYAYEGYENGIWRFNE